MPKSKSAPKTKRKPTTKRTACEDFNQAAFRVVQAATQDTSELIAETGVWSFDHQGKGREIKATLRPSLKHPNQTDLLLEWDDGQPVSWPVSLTGPDMRNLIAVLQEGLRALGYEV